ncbi:methyltransferase type 11 [Mycobacterium sp. ACS4331]|nr:methyltransferase type 11 [Mycobacterium sp. ACS4331]
MPRGGPRASWLSRRLQTDRLEYLDRDDVDELKAKVVASLDRGGRRPRFGTYEKHARIVMDEVSELDAPKILELGCGLGGLSRRLLELHPTAELTVTDIDPAFVSAIAAGDLGSHPRATVRTMDATAIDAPEGYFDLALFSLSLHHLPPELAARVLVEGTRAAKRLLIIDIHRPPPLFHVAMIAAVLPLARIPVVHDAIISGLRAYSPAALEALAEHADPAIAVDFRPRRRGLTVMVAARRGRQRAAGGEGSNRGAANTDMAGLSELYGGEKPKNANSKRLAQ